MTYHSRTSRTYNKRYNNLRKFTISWLKEKNTEHQVLYWNSGYADNCDPHTGKFNVWKDNGYKERGLKKRIRQYGKSLIRKSILDHDYFLWLEMDIVDIDYEYLDPTEEYYHDYLYCDEYEPLEDDYYLY